jgi:hypothetical protein
MYLGSFVSASDIIKKVCLRTEDTNMSKARMYASYMSAVWNDLRFDCTKTSVLRKYQINKRTNSLPLPSDCLMLFGVGYENEMGEIKPLWYNTKVPKKLLSENGVSCTCTQCGQENKSCAAIATVSNIDEIVHFNGQDYPKQTKVVVMTDGSVVKKITQPVLVNNGNSAFVEMRTTQEDVCKLELESCGCIKNTEDNNASMRLIQTSFCGLDYPTETYSIYAPENLGYAIDVTGEQILLPHSFPYDYVVLKYLTNITHEADFKIPAIAEEAFIRGIMYYSNADDPKSLLATRGIGGTTYTIYKAEQKKLQKRLRPTDYDKILGALGATRDNNFQRLQRLDVINSNNIDGWNQIYWFNRY